MKNEMGKIFTFLKQLRCYSISGFFHYVFLRIRGKSILVTGKCRGCGMCCRSISLEGADGWLRSEKAFQKIVGNFPEYSRFEIIGRDLDGFLLFSCTWKTPEGTCLDYDKRLALCRRFPESSLVFAGGRLPPTCGYVFTEGTPFKRILNKALHNQK